MLFGEGLFRHLGSSNRSANFFAHARICSVPDGWCEVRHPYVPVKRDTNRLKSRFRLIGWVGEELLSGVAVNTRSSSKILWIVGTVRVASASRRSFPVSLLNSMGLATKSAKTVRLACSVNMIGFSSNSLCNRTTVSVQPSIESCAEQKVIMANCLYSISFSFSDFLAKVSRCPSKMRFATSRRLNSASTSS